jgi:hypothetical protein
MVAYDPQALANAKAELPICRQRPIPMTRRPGPCLVLCTEWEESKSLDLAALKEAMAYPLIVEGRRVRSLRGGSGGVHLCADRQAPCGQQPRNRKRGQFQLGAGAGRRDPAPMRSQVTGAAGFIGSNLSAALVAEGHQVVGLDTCRSAHSTTSIRFRKSTWSKGTFETRKR